MSVTPINVSSSISDAEWRTRCDLAALYRLIHHYRMTDLIYTHLSARVPDEDGTFLINRYGELFDEVTASSLVKMDMDGNVVGEPGAFNMAGFNIHSGIYGARPDINCVLHTHTRAGVVVSSTKEGLQPISQHALIIYNEVSYFDYTGPGTTETPEDIGHGCGKTNCVVMRNHGLMTMGHTIPAAFVRMYYLELSCQIQESAASMAGGVQPIDPKVLEETLEQYAARGSAPELGQREWPGLLRLLERNGVEYAV
ncbi:MAG: class II aldolase/adducin family protein [Pseudomonadota bacterium]